MAKNAKQKRDSSAKVASELPSLWPPQDALSGWDRDAKLKSLLPPLDSPYDFKFLSQAETEALEAAFSDGFGSVTAYAAQLFPLPRGIDAGLLNHEFHYRSLLEEADPGDAFWEPGIDEQPAPSDTLPIRFIQRRLRMYFENQLNRFCHKVTTDDPRIAVWERDNVEDLALDRLYEKPWYEVHAIQLFEEFDEFLKAGPRLKRGSTPGLTILASCTAGELGRLIEQYYWRLRYEGAALTGLRAIKGASAGGKSKAALHRVEHAQWQKAASEIWSRRPRLTKAAVAEMIKKRFCVPCTAKHIARYITPART